MKNISKTHKLLPMYLKDHDQNRATISNVIKRKYIFVFKTYCCTWTLFPAV